MWSWVKGLAQPEQQESELITTGLGKVASGSSTPAPDLVVDFRLGPLQPLRAKRLKLLGAPWPELPHHQGPTPQEGCFAWRQTLTLPLG